MSGDPMCTFRAGSLWCVNDPCPNPNHRTPDPETRGIVPPPVVERPRPPTPVQPRRRRAPHCGHGSPLDDRCPYCAEGIAPDDYWDMVRVINALHQDQRRRRKPRAEKRASNERREHTMRACDVCGQSMLLNHDRPCGPTPGCTGWHTLTTGVEP